MKKFALGISVAIGLAIACSSAQAGVAVVVAASETASPSKSEISSVFLGRSKALAGIDQSGWSPVKERFYADVTRKNESQLKSYWSGLVFTGKGQPLSEVDGDAGVIGYITSNPGSIGYVDSASVTPAVKVVLTLD